MEERVLSEIKIEIDADSINQYVANAILQSKLGPLIKQSIDKELLKLSNSYNNPIEAVVGEIIKGMIRDMLTTDETYNTMITELVQQRVTETMARDIITKAWDALESRWR